LDGLLRLLEHHSAVKEMTLSETWFFAARLDSYRGTLDFLAAHYGELVIGIEPDRLTGHLPAFTGDLMKARAVFVGLALAPARPDDSLYW
jgi:hypothetical protein